MTPCDRHFSTSLEFAIRFIDWADGLNHPLTAAAIREKWKCSTATSYRWLRDYRAARGLPHPALNTIVPSHQANAA